jgi:Fatty acid desaturase
LTSLNPSFKVAISIHVSFGACHTENQLVMMARRRLRSPHTICHAYDGGRMSSGYPSFILDNSDDGNAGSAGPNSVTRRLLLAAVGNPASESWFERHDRPTLLVTAAIYASWLFLLASHRYIPWWITAPLAGYVVQWHFSLQHEAIHSLRGIPGWLRRALVWPPLGIWFPFELYRRSHSRHHRNHHLTHPAEDTESYYHEEEDWEGYGNLSRWLFIVNQTFLGPSPHRPFPAHTTLLHQGSW